MVIKSIVFALITYGLLFVISLLVAGIVKLVYFAVHKRETPKTNSN